jgi:hypothetical protein
MDRVAFKFEPRDLIIASRNRLAAAAAGLFFGLIIADTAQAQKQGGILRVWHRTAPGTRPSSRKDRRGAKDFQCVYHASRYDPRGNLKSVASGAGSTARGACPPEFRVEQHGLRQLRVTTLHGLVSGTFSNQTPAIEDFIGPEVLVRFNRVESETNRAAAPRLARIGRHDLDCRTAISGGYAT